MEDFKISDEEWYCHRSRHRVDEPAVVKGNYQA